MCRLGTPPPQEATCLVTEWVTDGRETVIMCIIVWVKAFQHFVYPRRTSLEGKSPSFHSIVSSPAPALWWPWSSSWLCRFSSHKNLMHSSVKLWVWSNVAQCMGLLIQHKLGTLEHILSLSLQLWFLFAFQGNQENCSYIIIIFSRCNWPHSSQSRQV